MFVPSKQLMQKKSWIKAESVFNDGDLKSVGEQNYKTCLANRCWTIHTNWTKKSL